MGDRERKNLSQFKDWTRSAVETGFNENKLLRKSENGGESANFAAADQREESWGGERQEVALEAWGGKLSDFSLATQLSERQGKF